MPWGARRQRVVETYDKAQEAQQIASGAQGAVAAMAAVEVGAVGLGTLVTILATTATADATGILLASVFAALGLFVIPARRRRAKIELREKIAEMREQLAKTLRQQFESEIERSLREINEAIAPYTRFVRAERGKLTDAQGELEKVHTGLAALRTLVEEI